MEEKLDPKIEIDFDKGEVPEDFQLNPDGSDQNDQKNTNGAEAEQYLKELEEGLSKAA